MLSLAGIVTNAVLTFAFFVAAGRLLGGRNAGALFEGMAVLAICTYAAMFGGDYGVLKLMPTVRRESARGELRLVIAALVPPIVVGLVICVALLTFRTEIADAIVRRGNQLGTQHVLVVFAPFVPIAAMTQVAFAAMRTWSIRDMVLVQNILLPVCRVALLLLVAQFRLTPSTAAVAWAAPLAVCAVIACGYLFSKCLWERRRVGSVPADGSTRTVALALWKFSGPRSLGGIFQILIAWLDVLLVGALASSSQSAAYAVASRYVITATFALNAIGIAIAPQLGRIFDRGDSKSAQLIYRESTWWVMAVTWPALVILVVYAPFMMHIFGRDYAAGIVSLQILGLAMLLNTGTGNNAVALLMGGGSRENLAVNAGALALNVCLNLVLIPRLGAAGRRSGLGGVHRLHQPHHLPLPPSTDGAVAVRWRLRSGGLLHCRRIRALRIGNSPGARNGRRRDHHRGRHRYRGLRGADGPIPLRAPSFRSPTTEPRFGHWLMPEARPRRGAIAASGLRIKGPAGAPPPPPDP